MNELIKMILFFSDRDVEVVEKKGFGVDRPGERRDEICLGYSGTVVEGAEIERDGSDLRDGE